MRKTPLPISIHRSISGDDIDFSTEVSSLLITDKEKPSRVWFQFPRLACGSVSLVTAASREGDEEFSSGFQMSPFRGHLPWNTIT
ncbi:hypothetical protein M5K25_005072 [Dendrobium thyrsiflorum]|uniref:Uncharacterized protein n=1 Tax=Dendrobium thyrsiflorum TaxID=117978 RepID=A0ABD0VHX3_DENTH